MSSQLTSTQLTINDKPLVDIIYPIGSVYITVSTTNPSVTFPGTTWSQINDKAYLCNVTTDADVNKYIDAGLPNITGQFKVAGSTGGLDNISGAFYQSTGNGQALNPGSNSGSGYARLDASRSSAVYGKSDTVTPYSFTVKIWVRTA